MVSRTDPNLAPAPRDLAREMDKAAKRGLPLDYVIATRMGTTVRFSIYPPKGSARTWRLYWSGAKGPKSCGSTPETVWAAIRANLGGIENDASAREHGHHTLSHMLDRYMAAQVQWSEGTRDSRRIDLANLRRLHGEVPCKDLSKAMIADAVLACGSSKRGAFVHRRIMDALRWGKRSDYLTAEQLDLASEVMWAPPEGAVGYREPRNRRQLAKRSGTSSKGVDRGEVPTAEQVSEWATSLGEWYTHGEGMFHLKAATGLRMGELLAICASNEPYQDAKQDHDGRGNWVDLENWVIHVNWQVESRGGKHLTLPKGEKVRTVDIPLGKMLRTGFDLRGWLKRRSAAALKEGAANPRALLLPNPRGAWWDESEFSGSVVVPATQALGWPVSTVTDAHGRVRRYQRFTPHSLRDFYAVTAVDFWKYKQSKLLRQGGWEDITTVMRYYYGADDDT